MASHIIYGNGAPAFTPEMKGQHYIDELNGKQYFSNDITSPSDWQLLGTGTSLENLEMFLEWSDAENNAYHAEFTEDGSGNLINKDVYTDPTKTTKLFALVYTYNGSGDVSSIVTTRISDSATMTRTFTYSGGGDLVSITYA